MGNPARKTYRAKRDSRRAQTFKLSLPGIVECPQCHEMKMAHRVCKNCGFYKGKEFVTSTEQYKESRMTFFSLYTDFFKKGV